MSRQNVPSGLIKVLWARSGGRCAICKKEIIMECTNNSPVPIGETAHIEGLRPNSPRYNPNMTDEERNSYENLIVVCPTCHTKIDKDPNYYTVERLRQIKREHEEWVKEQVKINIPDVTFAELEVIAKYLISVSMLESNQTLTIIPPKKKIQKNGLSAEVENLIIMGMAGIKQVKDYLNENPDFDFAGRLRNGFVQKYLELKQGGLTGDELFYELWNFASINSGDFKIRAAGLKILTYFFEICEVFDK